MVKAIVIIAASPAAVMMAFTPAFFLIRRVAHRRVREARAALETDEIIAIHKMANFVGRKSRFVAQVRGNGVLALTDRQLAFFMLLPKKEFRVPLERIQRIDHPLWFCGKSVGRELLVVHYLDEEGAEDAVGFRVPEPRCWGEEVTGAMAKRRRA